MTRVTPARPVRPAYLTETMRPSSVGMTKCLLWWCLAPPTRRSTWCPRWCSNDDEKRGGPEKNML